MSKAWLAAGAILLALALAGCGGSGGSSGGSSKWTHAEIAELEASLFSNPTINAAGRACIIKGVESKVSADEAKAAVPRAKEQTEAITRACAQQYKTTTQTPEEKGAEIAKQAQEETEKGVSVPKE